MNQDISLQKKNDDDDVSGVAKLSDSTDPFNTLKWKVAEGMKARRVQFFRILGKPIRTTSTSLYSVVEQYYKEPVDAKLEDSY